MKELFDLNLRLSAHARPFNRAKGPPAWLRLGKEKPDVLIDPANSQILQVWFFADVFMLVFFA